MRSAHFAARDAYRAGGAQRAERIRKSIALVEPVAQARLSGGYRYNDEVSAVLKARGLGGLVQVDGPDALNTVNADTLVIDSLWLGSARPSTLSNDTIELGHYFPPDNPLLPEQQKQDWLATAGDRGCRLRKRHNCPSKTGPKLPIASLPLSGLRER